MPERALQRRGEALAGIQRELPEPVSTIAPGARSAFTTAERASSKRATRPATRESGLDPGDRLLADLAQGVRDTRVRPCSYGRCCEEGADLAGKRRQRDQPVVDGAVQLTPYPSTRCLTAKKRRPIKKASD